MAIEFPIELAWYGEGDKRRVVQITSARYKKFPQPFDEELVTIEILDFELEVEDTQQSAQAPAHYRERLARTAHLTSFSPLEEQWEMYAFIHTFHPCKAKAKVLLQDSFLRDIWLGVPAFELLWWLRRVRIAANLWAQPVPVKKNSETYPLFATDLCWFPAYIPSTLQAVERGDCPRWWELKHALIEPHSPERYALWPHIKHTLSMYGIDTQEEME